MLIYKGIDIGNNSVKLSDGTIFYSTIREGQMPLNKKVYNVKWKGKEFIVGHSDGEINTTPDKVDTDHYQVMLLTAIAVSTPDEVIDIAVVTGIPIQYFDTLNLKFYKTIMEMETQTISVNGIKKTITIKACRIYPESAFPYLDESKYENIKTFVIDIGGGTVNCSMWVGTSLEQGVSYPNASISILHSLAKKITSTYGIGVDSATIDYLMEEDEYHGEDSDIDVSELKKEVFSEYTRVLISGIKGDFKMGSAKNIRIIGGTSIPLKDFLLKELKGFKQKVIIEDEPQFTNVRIYDELAKMYFKEIIESKDTAKKHVAVSKVN